jgi:hypothetical protein
MRMNDSDDELFAQHEIQNDFDFRSCPSSNALPFISSHEMSPIRLVAVHALHDRTGHCPVDQVFVIALHVTSSFHVSIFNVRYSRFNIQHSLFNIQHSTFNIQYIDRQVMVDSHIHVTLQILSNTSIQLYMFDPSID